jgi:hypothetical protein
MKNTEVLEAACLELACSATWEQKPIDAAEITRLAAQYAEIAKHHVSDGLNVDLAAPS